MIKDGSYDLERTLQIGLEICVIKRVRARPLDRDPTVQMSSARFNLGRSNALIYARVFD